MRKRKKVEFLENPIGVSIDAFEEEFFTEKSSVSEEHPTTEQLMLRQALKRLTVKQAEIWNLWNYDRMTQDEIATKLNIAQPVVAKHIKAIEKKITKYCQQRIEVYKLLKEQEESTARVKHQRKVTDYHNRDSKY